MLYELQYVYDDTQQAGTLYLVANTFSDAEAHFKQWWHGYTLITIDRITNAVAVTLAWRESHEIP